MTVNTSARKIAVVLSDFNYTRIFFSTEFRKEKNCNVKLNENPSGCFMRADKRTDRLAKNITVAFRNFAEVPKKLYLNKNIGSLSRYSLTLLQFHVAQVVCTWLHETLGAKEHDMKFKLRRNIERINFKNTSSGLSTKYEYTISPQFRNHSHSTTY